MVQGIIFKYMEFGRQNGQKLKVERSYTQPNSLDRAAENGRRTGQIGKEQASVRRSSNNRNNSN